MAGHGTLIEERPCITQIIHMHSSSDTAVIVFCMRGILLTFQRKLLQ